MGKTTVNVTQRHIDEGHRCNCNSCPLAIALQEALGLTTVSVGAHTFQRDNHYKAERELLPSDARKFRSDFDNNLPVKPFSFEVD